jgi:hypothetical protein
MEIHNISRGRFLHTVGWGLAASLIVVGMAAGIGRATMNLGAALTDNPDLAIYVLLPDEAIGKIEILREEENERHYQAETKEGTKLIILKKGESEWYVSHIESLLEDPILEEPKAETE